MAGNGWTGREQGGPDHASTRTGSEHESDRDWDLSHQVRCKLSQEAPETIQHIKDTGCKMLAGKALCCITTK